MTADEVLCHRLRRVDLDKLLIAFERACAHLKCTKALFDSMGYDWMSSEPTDWPPLVRWETERHLQ